MRFVTCNEVWVSSARAGGDGDDDPADPHRHVQRGAAGRPAGLLRLPARHLDALLHDLCVLQYPGVYRGHRPHQVGQEIQRRPGKNGLHSQSCSGCLGCCSSSWCARYRFRSSSPGSMFVTGPRYSLDIWTESEAATTNLFIPKMT